MTTGIIAIIFCLLVGIGLTVFEALLPGFGLPGITGITLMCAGSVLVWVTYGPTAGVCTVLAVLVLAILAVWLSFRSAAKGKLSRSKIILADTEAPKEEHSIPMGKQGSALTILNPVGMAEFDGVRTQVISRGEYIQKGTAVRVSGYSGHDPIVDKI